MTDASSRLDELTDEAVLAVHVDRDALRRDREAAFAELLHRFQRRVFAVCQRTLPDAVDAEEATQEVFVRLLRHADTFRGEAKLSTWLYAVARNVATDRVRHEARRPATPVDDLATVAPAGAFTTEDTAAAASTTRDLAAALALLDATSRELLWLVAVEGLSYADAAAAHDLPVGTVKSRVSRARLRLGELLAEDDAASPPGAPTARRPDRASPDRSTLPRGPPA